MGTVKLLLKSGVRVIGLDIDHHKVSMLENGQSYIEHIDAQNIKTSVVQGVFIPSTDFSLAKNDDVSILCVPTQLTRQREPDLSFFTGSVDSLLPHLRDEQLLSLESTTYPRTTKDVIQPRLEQAGFTIGQDFFLVYSPEREDPNNSNFIGFAIRLNYFAFGVMDVKPIYYSAHTF